MTRTTTRLPRLAAALLAGGLVLAACGQDTDTDTDTAVGGPSAAPARGSLPDAHVHGVAFDPGDGALLLATHDGLLEVGRDGELTRLSPVIDLMGFTVVGADHYLASGHPGPGVDLPEPVGLIESTDGGRTWTELSRQGQSDFHALTTGPAGGVLGYDGSLTRSADGRTWEQLTIPGQPHTLAAAPDGATVLATTAEGLLRSADAGGSWSTVGGAPLLQVVDWADDGSRAVGVDPAGTVWSSSDGNAWEQSAQLGAAPHAVTVAPDDAGALRVAVVTDEALLESVDGGQTFTEVLTR
jgi:hypothetical protein